jgi:NTE family protein
VLEGGGVKGLGVVGAVTRLMEEGYAFHRTAGTSAGSIVAAFVAAGAGSEKLSEVMSRLDFQQVPDRAPPGIPLVSEAIALIGEGGAHPGHYIHKWIKAELKKLGVSTFADLRLRDRDADKSLRPSQRYRLVVMATDITHGRLLRLPWDYPRFGLDPNKQLVADAVRASISIPLYFEPRTLRNKRTGEESTLVDGGVLSNFPVEIFDRTDRREPRWPTFGVRVIPALPGADAELFPPLGLPTLPPVRLLEQVLATAIVGHDQSYIERPCVRRRMIAVDTSAVGIVEFNASKEKRDGLVQEGEQAARRFLRRWNWDAYRAQCRGGTNDA